MRIVPFVLLLSGCVFNVAPTHDATVFLGRSFDTTALVMLSQGDGLGRGCVGAPIGWAPTLGTPESTFVSVAASDVVNKDPTLPATHEWTCWVGNQSNVAFANVTVAMTPTGVGQTTLYWVVENTMFTSAFQATTTAIEVVDADADGDGYDDPAAGGDDCDDTDAAVNPGAAEVCNGIDDDCTGTADEGFPDADADTIPDCVDDEFTVDVWLDAAWPANPSGHWTYGAVDAGGTFTALDGTAAGSVTERWFTGTEPRVRPRVSRSSAGTTFNSGHLVHRGDALVVRPGDSEEVAVRFTAPADISCDFELELQSAREGRGAVSADASVWIDGVELTTTTVDGFYSDGADLYTLPGLALLAGQELDFRLAARGDASHDAVNFVAYATCVAD